MFCQMLRDLGQLGSGVVELMVADHEGKPTAAHIHQQQQQQDHPGNGTAPDSHTSTSRKGSMAAGSGGAAELPASAANAEGGPASEEQLRQVDADIRKGAQCRWLAREHHSWAPHAASRAYESVSPTLRCAALCLATRLSSVPAPLVPGRVQA